LFWKKETIKWHGIRTAWLRAFRKKTKPEPEMFHFYSRERRKWFRIQPSELEPIVLRIDDHTVDIRDIGAYGLSFDNDNFPIGPLESCQIDLPELGPAIPIKLEILEIDEKDVCHCWFKTIEEGAVERIHHYVLRRQKEILREQKEQAIRARQTAHRGGTDPPA
jgi:hypothetical protein